MGAELDIEKTLFLETDMHSADIRTKIRSMNNVIGSLRQQIHESILHGDILKEQKLWRTMDTLMDRRLNLVNEYFSVRH